VTPILVCRFCREQVPTFADGTCGMHFVVAEDGRRTRCKGVRWAPVPLEEVEAS
jgi:hypothetical protein